MRKQTIKIILLRLLLPTAAAYFFVSVYAGSWSVSAWPEPAKIAAAVLLYAIAFFAWLYRLAQNATSGGCKYYDTKESPYKRLKFKY